jgi:hypothetical protein
MPKYEISAMYEYGGQVEADSEEEAYQIFIDDLDAFYYGTYSYDIEEVEEDE